MSDVQSWSHYRTDTVQFAEEDLEGVEIVEVWIDSGGSIGKQGQTYVLLRMSADKAEAIMARPESG